MRLKKSGTQAIEKISDTWEIHFESEPAEHENLPARISRRKKSRSPSRYKPARDKSVHVYDYDGHGNELRENGAYEENAILRWQITAMLFIDGEVENFVEVWSRNLDMDEAVMMVVKRVWDLGAEEEGVASSVSNQLADTDKPYKKANICMSKRVRIRIDVTDIVGAGWHEDQDMYQSVWGSSIFSKKPWKRRARGIQIGGGNNRRALNRSKQTALTEGKPALNPARKQLGQPKTGRTASGPRFTPPKKLMP